MTDVINKQTLSEQIYQILRQDILTQQLKSGEKLTLQILKDRFNVSHTPIREALTRLVEDDLVTYHSNIGITVVSLSQRDVRELFELSGDLDCLALRYATRGTVAKDFLAELDENVTRSGKCLEENQMDCWSDLSDRFHLILYKFADNTRLEKAAQKLRAQTTLVTNRYQLQEENLRQIQHDHEEILKALQVGDIDHAIERVRRHLDNDLKLALQVVD